MSKHVHLIVRTRVSFFDSRQCPDHNTVLPRALHKRLLVNIQHSLPFKVSPAPSALPKHYIKKKIPITFMPTTESSSPSSTPYPRARHLTQPLPPHPGSPTLQSSLPVQEAVHTHHRNQILPARLLVHTTRQRTNALRIPSPYQLSCRFTYILNRGAIYNARREPGPPVNGYVSILESGPRWFIFS